MKSTALLALALAARVSCAFPSQIRSASSVVGSQDAVRLSPAGSIPAGGITDPGRVAGAVTARFEHPVTSSERTAQRAPIVSWGTFVAYGLDRGDLWTNCRFADARLSASPNPMLAPSSPHVGILWRCGAGGRFMARVSPSVRLVFGGSIAADNTLVQRDITETITEFAPNTSGGLFGSSPTPVARTVIEYSERQTSVQPMALAHFGAQFDPLRWLRFDAAIATGFATGVPRTVLYSASSPSPASSYVASLPVTETSLFAYGWLGASFGPEFARFALQLQAGGDAIGAVFVGVDGAMVFSLDTRPPTPTRDACSGPTCQGARRP
ncbi:MAG: hypothetical protein JNK05_05005 [Myxococcales bacterium]|nr:hypothetical protein [Myxococcales bacterium]